jgi:hypothetical protein
MSQSFFSRSKAFPATNAFQHPYSHEEGTFDAWAREMVRPVPFFHKLDRGSTVFPRYFLRIFNALFSPYAIGRRLTCAWRARDAIADMAGPRAIGNQRRFILPTDIPGAAA